MYRIRRFGVIKTATIVAVMYMLLIAILVVPFAILAIALNPRDAAVGGVALLVGGLFAAILYAAIGWLFTAIACVIYNVAAGWTGGIEVQVEPVAPSEPVPVWGPPTYPSPPAAPTGG